MRQHDLFGTLQGIVSIVLASAACGGATDAETTGDAKVPPPPPDEPSFACATPLASLVSNLNPVQAVDYIELRANTFGHPHARSSSDGGAFEEAPILATEAVLSEGEACSTAADKADCLSRLQALRLSGGGDGWTIDFPTNNEMSWPRRRAFVVFTRGDSAVAIRTSDELKAFLGTIDSIEEARLLLSTQMRDLVCTTTPFKSGWRRNPDGSWELLLTGSKCGGGQYQNRVKVSLTADVSIEREREIESHVVCGRRPTGLTSGVKGGAETSVAAWLAEAAHLEAASVFSFRRLERELRMLGAPKGMIDAARRSRADEIRHAREMTLLARRFGSAPPPVEIADDGEQGLFEIALENAVEGCVRETYGALVAMYQARCASDPELRSVLTRIARDEARHAALAHDVADWIEPRLGPEERTALARTKREAIADLRRAVATPPASDVAELAGMPRPREARALLDALL
jgi:hypothetical protein